MIYAVDTGTGIIQVFPVFPVSKPCIIALFVGNGAVIDGFRAAITDIGSLIETVTAFLDKVRMEFKKIIFEEVL